MLPFSNLISTAFDNINHNILIRRLQHWFNISFTALNLLSTFLSDRYQTVLAPNSKSQLVLLLYASAVLRGGREARWGLSPPPLQFYAKAIPPPPVFQPQI